MNKISLSKKYGWKFLGAAFFGYLLRDLTIYVLLPMLIGSQFH